MAKSDAFLVSYADPAGLLSTSSRHAIFLDGFEWPSVEHYVQAMKYDSESYRERIRQADHPRSARKLGASFWQRKKASWKSEREIYMTRGMYFKCRTHREVAEALLATGERPILDTTNYDYFWGCGRDTRGHNRFGNVLMAVRERLRSERAGDSAGA